MREISGFTFIHNALNGGYPVFEAMAAVLPYVQEMVVVDMESDDGTRKLLEHVASKCPNGIIKIVDGEWWPGKAGRCLSYNHSLHAQYCTKEVVWHFEADEVFSDELAQEVQYHIHDWGHPRLSVHRIQVEQNFQRVRWYPEPVHRVWMKSDGVAKSGHTTTMKDFRNNLLPPRNGLLWDVTNCFRDNWEARVRQQAELWGDDPNMLYVPYHINVEHFLTWEYIAAWKKKPHWTWTSSPLNIPRVLQPHIGKTMYEPILSFFEFMDGDVGDIDV